MAEAAPVTPRKLRPAELVRAVTELAQERAGVAFRDRVKATTQLVAGILHEFNTPLGALRSSLDTARSALTRLDTLIERDPARARAIVAQLGDILGVARTATERIVDTVEALSHFARVDRADVDEVDAAQLIETVLRLTGLSRARTVKLVRRFDPSRIRVRCRVREVEHVLYHLLRNAHEVMADREAAVVELGLTREGDQVVISVQDNGPGIDPAKLPTLFEPTLTTKGTIVGLGLSLPTCHFIAQEHGGSLEVENVPTGGARFTFRFRPALPQPAA